MRYPYKKDTRIPQVIFKSKVSRLLLSMTRYSEVRDKYTWDKMHTSTTRNAEYFLTVGVDTFRRKIANIENWSCEVCIASSARNLFVKPHK